MKYYRREKRLAIKSELQIRKKALQRDDFPSEEIIDEFMQEPIDMSSLQLDWSQPNMVKFVVSILFLVKIRLVLKCLYTHMKLKFQKMMGKLIQWDEIYCFQKFLPLLTRWQLHHGSSSTNLTELRGSVQPDFIKKKRTPKGVPSYEIIWKDEQHCFDMLIPHDQLQTFYETNKEKNETDALHVFWSTIEPIDLVEKAYPELVLKFEESKAKGKSKKTKTSDEPAKAKKGGRKAKNTNLETDTTEGVLEKAPKKKVASRAGAKTKKKQDENVRPIDLFFQKQQPSAGVYSSPKIKTTTKPMNLSTFSLNFNDSNWLDDDDGMNLSSIINEMLARPPNVIEFNGKKLKFDEVETKTNQSLSLSTRAKDTEDNHSNIKADNDEQSEESMDEFDMIVMRKARKSFVAQRKMRLDSISMDVPNNCSTPVSRRPSLKSNIQMNLSLELETSKNRKNAVISSSFFGVNQEDEIDLFEKSIDFRNMQDSADADDDEVNESESSSSAENSPVVEEDVNHYDTFDRLVGLG